MGTTHRMHTMTSRRVDEMSSAGHGLLHLGLLHQDRGEQKIKSQISAGLLETGNTETENGNGRTDTDGHGSQIGLQNSSWIFVRQTSATWPQNQKLGMPFQMSTMHA